MKTFSPSEIALEIEKSGIDSRTVLFVGAGVGKRVGLPTWNQFMEHLADECRKFSEDIAAALIEERANKGQYLEAATVYTTCSSIPIGELYKGLAKPFLKDRYISNIEKIEPLTKLPIGGIISTNYDRSLFEAYSRFSQISPIPLEINDGTLKNAANISEFFIARIHGRAELPESIVINNDHYESLRKNDIYQDYLASVLRSRPVIFVGFSFLDPAIRSVLDALESSFSPNFPNLHTAVLSNKADPSLRDRLARVNVRTIFYQETPNHAELWRALTELERLCSNRQEKINLGVILPQDLPPSEIHRLLAFSYARIKISPRERRPVLEEIQKGVFLSILDDEPSAHLEKGEALNRMRKILKVDHETSIAIFNRSLNALIESGEVEQTSRYITRKSCPANELESELEEIAGGMQKRLKIISGISLDLKMTELVPTFIESIFIRRAWDLAPQYAGSATLPPLDFDSWLPALARNHFQCDEHLAEKISSATEELFKRPEPGESKILASISRTAVTLQILITSPRHRVANSYDLPETLYLDASVILPAIAKGHPLEKGYREAVARVIESAKKAGEECKMVVSSAFLDEIIAHRRNAAIQFEELGLDDQDEFIRYISYTGADNTNVFIGGYSQELMRPGLGRSFAKYLADAAPYDSLTELTLFLSRRGILVEEMKFDRKNNIEYNHIFTNLKDAYENDRMARRAKDALLIQHEAQQLTRLFLDRADGGRSVFITADLRLRRLVQGSAYLSKLSGSMLSEIGFLGLVDILTGGLTDTEVFARLIWAHPRTDLQRQIQDYLIKSTLAKYDDAMAREMSDVLNVYMKARKGEIEIFRERVSGLAGVTKEKEVSKFVDRLESEYFEKMERAIARREAGEAQV